MDKDELKYVIMDLMRLFDVYIEGVDNYDGEDYYIGSDYYIIRGEHRIHINELT